MARRRTSSRGRLPPANVAWLPQPLDPDSQPIVMREKLVAGVQVDRVMYSFDPRDATSLMGRTYGGGDWTIERHIGALFIAPIGLGADDQNKKIRICFGLGMVGGGRTAASASSSVPADIQSEPEASWMIYVCCDVRLGQFEVTKCDLSFGRSRRIEEGSQLFASMRVNDQNGLDVPNPVEGSYIDVSWTSRFLVR